MRTMGTLAARTTIVAAALLAEGAMAMAQGPQPLWPDGAPGALGDLAEDVPTLTAYLPEPEAAAATAIVVCPGGGYQGHADHEGEPIARWLNSVGITAFVLKYRLGPKYHHPCQLEDAARAIRTVRARAAEWGVDPDRIGILGFSAGGHLASTAGTHFDAGDPDATDPIDRVSSRPDLMVLIYPVISFEEFGHIGSRDNLLGEDPDPELVRLLSNHRQVTADTPPAFLVHTDADTGVPCENSLLFALALREAGVPVELHLFEPGEHGFGLGGGHPALSLWPKLCEEWLRERGFLPKPGETEMGQ